MSPMERLLKIHQCHVTLEFYDPRMVYHAFVSFSFSPIKRENVDLDDPTYEGIMEKLQLLCDEIEEPKVSG